MLYLRSTARGDFPVCSMCECVTMPGDVSMEMLTILYLVDGEVECPYCGE